MTKTAKRRRGERPSGGLYCPTRGTLVHFSAAFLLHSKLAGIVAALKPLSEQNGIVKFLNNVDCADTLNGFVQELAYAVTDYQVCDTSTIAGFSNPLVDIFTTKHLQEHQGDRKD